MKRLSLAALGVVAVLALPGCTELTTLYGSLTSQTPTQVTTLGDAETAATLIAQATDTYVNSASPNRATLLELQSLNNAVHAALTSLETAQANGGSLVFDSFNAALAAFDAYAASQGVKT